MKGLEVYIDKKKYKYKWFFKIKKSILKKIIVMKKF